MRCFVTDLSDLLQKIIDASGFLYTTTTLGKTVLDEKGDKFIGTYSDAASIESVRELVTQGRLLPDPRHDHHRRLPVFIESKYADMVLATTEEMRAGYFTYEGVTMKDFMEALLARFKKTKGYPLKTVAPPQPRYPEPWVSNSDPKWNDKPEIITYNRFFQHSMKFLQDNKLLDEIVMTFGVSSALYVATNAYGLAQNSFIGSAAWQCIGFETGAASGAQLGSGKRAWTVAGDGGFMMVCQSLSTLAQKQSQRGHLRDEQRRLCDRAGLRRHHVVRAWPKHKFDTFDILPKWDYMALAKAFGAKGYRVKTISELNAALNELKNTDQTSRRWSKS